MRTFAVSMDCPHATRPTILVDVAIRDETARVERDAAAAAVWGGHRGTRCRLWIPALNTWTLDTTRMVLWELSAYVPPEPEAFFDPPDPHRSLLAGVQIGTRRGARTPQDLVDTDVEFFVSSRGWSAAINPKNNLALPTKTLAKRWREGRFPSGRWSEPMRAALLDLAEKSPVDLMNVTEELPGDALNLGLRFSPRHTIQEGYDTPANIKTERQAEAWLARVRRVRQTLDSLEDNGRNTQ
jgi:hypothetical protein